VTEVTVVIPVGPYHEAVASNAVASCQLQTVPVSVVVVKDCYGAGAGYARNRGLEQVETPFVVWLDADDTIAPTFVERCLSTFNGSKYIYTDHYAGDKLIPAPDCAWVNRTWHCITTLLPTEWARHIGGFDETMVAFEDTDFYLKLVTSGYCGKRLPEPLFHYGDGGQRSKAHMNTPTHDAAMRRFSELYGRRHMACGDCGTPNIDLPPVGDPLPGDVLAIATWAGNRQERGRATGRLYARSGNGKQMYVAPADIDVSPHLWRRLDAPTPPTAQPRMTLPAEANVRVITPTPVNAFPQVVEYAPLDGAVGVGQAFNDFQRATFPAPPPMPPQPVVPAAVTPDVAKAVALYQAAVNG
jgi:hypothetical protein